MGHCPEWSVGCCGRGASGCPAPEGPLRFALASGGGGAHVLTDCVVWSPAVGFPGSQWRMEGPEGTPQHQNRCCHSEGPQTSQKAHSVDVDPLAAAGFLKEGFLSGIAGAWSQWAWGTTEPI